MEDETKVTQVHARVPLGDDLLDEEACLVLIYPPGPDLGRRFELVSPEIVIGRGHDCDLLLDRDAVSRKHARIKHGDEGWRVTDLDSTNGTYVNDVFVRDHVLRDGDRVRIGNAIFKFLTGGNIESAYHEEIYQMTIKDGLTRAFNKRFLLEHLERELISTGRHERPLSLALLDVDHFKQVNDNFGHLTGDHVLKELASRIQGRVREDEVFARYGGEEFAVVLREMPHEAAVRYAETLRTLVSASPFVFEGQSIAVTISVGVATANERVPVLSFMKAADDCLYQAKRGGRNRVVGQGEAANP